MRAEVGDHIVIETVTLDSPRRHGEVVEVIGQADRRHRIACAGRTGTNRCLSRARSARDRTRRPDHSSASTAVAAL